MRIFALIFLLQAYVSTISVAIAQTLPPPQNLRVAFYICGTTRFEWDAPTRSDLIGYYFSRQEQEGGEWSSPELLAPQFTSYVEPGGLPHCYRVSAIYPDGESEAAQSCGGAIADAWMFPPSYVGLKAEGDSIQIDWDSGLFGCGGPVGYDISRSREGEEWSVIASVAYNITSFIDRNLEPGRWCYFVTIVSTDEKRDSPTACDILAGTTSLNDDAEAFVSKRFFRLEQNHPNPFNPSTTISVDLPRASEVTLKIFDLVGHEVATLAQQRMQAGRYSFKWDASGMPGGVYFYRLQTEAFTQTRKLLLLR